MTNERRGPTIAESMAMIAAAAFSLFAYRSYLQCVPRSYYENIVVYTGLASSGLLAPPSVILFIVSACRTDRSRWANDPAVVVGLTVTLLSAACGLFLAAAYLWVGPPRAMVGFQYLNWYCVCMTEQTGRTIAVYGITQALGGRLQRPRGWVDWTAWTLAVGWILIAPTSQVAFLL